MNQMLSSLDVTWSERLGWTILHSLWQIAVVTIVYAGASLWLRRSSAGARYALGCLALVAMICLPLATFVLHNDARSQPTVLQSTDVALSAVDPAPEQRSAEPSAPMNAPIQRESGSLADVALSVGPFLPWISGGWVLGVVLFSVRPLLGLVTVRRLRSRGLSPPSTTLAQLAGDLIARLGVRQSVQVAQSALVQVPTVLGYLRPIVLLPASALTGLSAEQLELILAHELAHVRRHDYLVNLLQTGIETILFYHPGTWWVSAQVRKERENCCDDVAVGLCGNRGTYVRALLAMEQQRALAPLVLAASGGSLLERARRLLSPSASPSGLQRASAWLAGLLPLGVVTVFILLSSTFSASGDVQDTGPQEKQPAADAKDVETAAPPAAEAPKAEVSKPAPAAEAVPAELVMTVTLEDNARDPITVVLKDSYRRVVKTWDNVVPGKVQLTLPSIEDGRYLIEVSAKGYGLWDTWIHVSKKRAAPYKQLVELYRRRYAVLRYAANMQGERQLTGPDVKEGRVAISFGTIADLNGDWNINQEFNGKGSRNPVLDCRRYGQNGTAVQPQGTSYDDIKLAPPNDKYKPEDLILEKGMVLLDRIVGNGPGERRYAKILVEDITEKPPQGVEVIETFQLSTRVPENRAKKVEPQGGRDPENLAVTVDFEDGVRRPVQFELREAKWEGRTLKTWKDKEPGEIKLDLPALEVDRYKLIARCDGYAEQMRWVFVSNAGTTMRESKFKLYRLRYLVLHYFMNVQGGRSLKGAAEYRVAVASGSIPELWDWRVKQMGGKLRAVVVRPEDPTVGFAPAPDGKAFGELDDAPKPDNYTSEGFVFKKGMIVFTHVVGWKPEHEHYAKLLVEDITETPAKELVTINSWPK